MANDTARVERDGPDKVVTAEFGNNIKAVSMSVTTMTPIAPPYEDEQIEAARVQAVKDNDAAAAAHKAR